MIDTLQLRAFERAQQLAEQFERGSWERYVIELLATHARGQEKSKTVDWLLECLSHWPGGAGKKSKDIQNKVIKFSRRAGTECFICSWRKGYYIPLTQQDTEPMNSFYEQRIAQENANCNNLFNFALSLPRDAS